MMSNIEKEKQFDIAYDHYKITVEQVKKKEKDRDNLFLYLIIFLGISLMFSLKPIDSTYFLNTYIQQKMNLNIEINSYLIIIEMVLWTILFYISLRYFQRVISVKNKINYMRNLEKEIQKNFFYREDDFYINFSRDSSFYDSNLSNLTKFAKYFYSFIFPAFYSIIVLIKIIQQIKLNLNYYCFNSSWSFSLLSILFILILLFILLILYIKFQIKSHLLYLQEMRTVE